MSSNQIDENRLPENQGPSNQTGPSHAGVILGGAALALALIGNGYLLVKSSQQSEQISQLQDSTQVQISKLSNATAGSHELSLGLQFGCKPKKKRFRTISCPSF